MANQNYTDSVFTPHAEVIVFNFKNRFSSDKLQDPMKIEEVILLGGSIQKISTTKSKSAPAGGFEIQLAPTFNWTTRITPGSWVAILMTPREKINISPTNIGQAQESQLKMVGRIDSVRGALSVDGEGARSLTYVVTGQDWGSVFETNLYLDPVIIQSSGFSNQTQVGKSQLMYYAKWLSNLMQTSNTIPSSTENVEALIGLWGIPAEGLAKNINSSISSAGLSNGLQITSGEQYNFPKELCSFVGPNAKQQMSGNIKIIAGVLTGYDKYKDSKEAFAFIQPNSVMGTHTLWELLQDNCNNLLNELVPEITWPDGNMQFSLYKRIRPFISRDIAGTNPIAQNPEAKKNASLMRNVRRHVILSGDVLSCNFGTNWRDAFNFVEVMPEVPMQQVRMLSNEAKIKSQEADLNGFARDGFRPMIRFSPFVILPDQSREGDTSVNFTAMTQWKLLLKEWYFNTQGLLNGSVVFMGQSHYIAVGDNIQIDARILGLAPMNAAQGGNCYLLAHIESISHDFSVNDDGARSFVTSVNFVRGYISDAAGAPVDPNTGMAIDKDGSAMQANAETQPNVFNSGRK